MDECIFKKIKCPYDCGFFLQVDDVIQTFFSSSSVRSLLRQPSPGAAAAFCINRNPASKLTPHKAYSIFTCWISKWSRISPNLFKSRTAIEVKHKATFGKVLCQGLSLFRVISRAQCTCNRKMTFFARRLLKDFQHFLYYTNTITRCSFQLLKWWTDWT